MPKNQPPKIIQWVMRYSGGYIRDERTAAYALAGLVVAMMIIAIVYPLLEPVSHEIPTNH